MMGPISHFLVGMLCGAAIGAVAVAFRRRWALYLPPLVLACGFWAEMPWLVGARETTHAVANVFFGYAWLHPWVAGREGVAFVCFLAIANLLLLGPVAFLTWSVWTVDTIRWEREGGKRRGKPAVGRHSRRSAREVGG
jgi:hypothetical protein